MIYLINTTIFRTIKLKPIDMKICTYIEFHVENNDADPKFKVGDYMRISKYKNKFEYLKFQ